MTLNWLSITMVLIAGISTGVGALPLFFTKDISRKQIDIGLGLSAGIMLVASFFSLIQPSLDSAQEVFTLFLGIYPVLLGLFLGYYIILKIHNHLPHQHLFKDQDVSFDRHYQRVTLIILAICLHNFPEGLAVGVGFGQAEQSKGVLLAIGIAIQNMPEGLVVALGLLSLGQPKSRAIFLAFLSGLIEPVAAVLGYGFSTISIYLLPGALSFAGGAMLFVTCQEMLPELFREGHEKNATLGVISGIGLMMVSE